MNFIEKIVEEYNGKYSEDVLKKIYTPGGIATYQPKCGIINVDGSEIRIIFKEAGGILNPTDPIRILLKLKTNFKRKLSIFPTSYFDYFIDIFFHSKSQEIPKSIGSQFSFRGDKKLIAMLLRDEEFPEKIKDENIYITIDKKNNTNLVLTPAFGIENINHFRKMVEILKIVEAKIMQIKTLQQ